MGEVQERVLTLCAKMGKKAPKKALKPLGGLRVEEVIDGNGNALNKDEAGRLTGFWSIKESS